MENLETPASAVTPESMYRPLNYTGEVCFYTFRGAPNEDGYEWFEYAAELVAGKLQRVERTHRRGSTGALNLNFQIDT